MKKSLTVGALLLSAMLTSTFAEDNCIEDATVSLDTSGNYTGLMPRTSSCVPYVNSFGTSWSGVCMIGTGPTCTNNPTSGTMLTVAAVIPQLSDTKIGDVWVFCRYTTTPAHADIILPANCVNCSYRFIGGCSISNCAVGVCYICNASITPPPQ